MNNISLGYDFSEAEERRRQNIALIEAFRLQLFEGFSISHGIEENEIKKKKISRSEKSYQNDDKKVLNEPQFQYNNFCAELKNIKESTDRTVKFRPDEISIFIDYLINHDGFGNEGAFIMNGYEGCGKSFICKTILDQISLPKCTFICSGYSTVKSLLQCLWKRILDSLRKFLRIQYGPDEGTKKNVTHQQLIQKYHFPSTVGNFITMITVLLEEFVLEISQNEIIMRYYAPRTPSFVLHLDHFDQVYRMDRDLCVGILNIAKYASKYMKVIIASRNIYAESDIGCHAQLCINLPSYKEKELNVIYQDYLKSLIDQCLNQIQNEKCDTFDTSSDFLHSHVNETNISELIMTTLKQIKKYSKKLQTADLSQSTFEFLRIRLEYLLICAIPQFYTITRHVQEIWCGVQLTWLSMYSFTLEDSIYLHLLNQQYQTSENSITPVDVNTTTSMQSLIMDRTEQSNIISTNESKMFPIIPTVAYVKEVVMWVLSQPTFHIPTDNYFINDPALQKIHSTYRGKDYFQKDLDWIQRLCPSFSNQIHQIKMKQKTIIPIVDKNSLMVTNWVDSIPMITRYLIITAFIAANNPATTDMKIFTVGISKKRKKGSLKEIDTEKKVLDSSFSLERWLSLYDIITRNHKKSVTSSTYDIKIDRHSSGFNKTESSTSQQKPFDSSQNIDLRTHSFTVHSMIQELIHDNLLQSIVANHSKKNCLDKPRYISLISQSMAEDIARSIQFNLYDYMAYYSGKSI